MASTHSSSEQGPGWPPLLSSPYQPSPPFCHCCPPDVIALVVLSLGLNAWPKLASDSQQSCCLSLTTAGMPSYPIMPGCECPWLQWFVASYSEQVRKTSAYRVCTLTSRCAQLPLGKRHCQGPCHFLPSTSENWEDGFVLVKREKVLGPGPCGRGECHKAVQM